MPSPAQDTFASVSHAWREKNTRSWVSSDPYYISRDARLQSQALKCPATVVNRWPIGVSPPMSPWSKQWFRGVCRPSSYSFRIWDDSRNNTLVEASNAVLYSGLPGQSSSGLYWEFVNREWPFNPVREFAADNNARTATLNKLSQKKWDLGVSALELKQTAGLLTEVSTSMVRTLTGLINTRKNARKAANNFFRRVQRTGSVDKAAAELFKELGKKDIGLLNTLKDGWMQYQFGIKPSLQDVNDAVDYLASRHSAGVPFLVHAKAGNTSEDEFWTPWRGDRIIDGRMDSRYKYRETCDVHFSVTYEMPTGQVRDLTALGLDNPYSIAWEVTQLSWMVDYVVGIGDWLQSFTATNGMIFREGCRSRLRRLTLLDCETRFKRRAQWINSVALSDLLTLERGDFSRTLLESRLLPAVVPQIKSSLGLTQLGNSLFALSNVFSGNGRIYR